MKVSNIGWIQQNVIVAFADSSFFLLLFFEKISPSHVPSHFLKLFFLGAFACFLKLYN